MPPAHPPRRSARLVAAVLGGALVLAAAGCGSDPDIDQAEFQEKLVERTTIPEDVAACITERVFEEFPEDIDRIVRAASVEELGDAEAGLDVINRQCWEANAGEPG